MLFMGQEIYEDKRWADDPPNHKEALIWWDGLATDKTMIDFHRFSRDLIWLRRRQPALRGEGVENGVDGERSTGRWCSSAGSRELVATSWS